MPKTENYGNYENEQEIERQDFEDWDEEYYDSMEQYESEIRIERNRISTKFKNSDYER